MLNEFKEFNRKLADRFKSKNLTDNELKNESATSFEARERFNRVQNVKHDSHVHKDAKHVRSSTPVILLADDESKSLTKKIPAKYLMAQDLHLQCPVILHNKIAFDVNNTTCRCSKHCVPLVRDLEFDFFLDILPEDQILLVAVIDSW